MITPREAEILGWIAKGKSNVEIGLIIGISPLTAKNHVQHIIRKLDVCDRTSAVVKAYEEGILHMKLPTPQPPPPVLIPIFAPPQFATMVEPELMEDLREFLTQHSDTVDGSDGPRPNQAMHLHIRLDQCLRWDESLTTKG